MRIIYSAIFYIATPFILLRLFRRGKQAPQYRQRWSERLALYRAPRVKNVLWFHAVSVGEVEAVFPLVSLFQQRLPDYPVLITTTSLTSSMRVQKVYGDTIEHVYLPYDLPCAIKRFLEHFQPAMAVIMETEIWPNLFAHCGKKAIPIAIVNARLSQKSAKGYQRTFKLISNALRNVNFIAAQTIEDRDRYLTIGADAQQVIVTGNIKFDMPDSAAHLKLGKKLRSETFPERLVWIVASTHKGEEALFLECYKLLKQQFPELLLLLVPRHPERFEEVRDMALQAGLQVVMRTENKICTKHVDVYIADTMGELKMIYASADVAFVAGSMQPIGGHNVLEAAGLGIPVLFGPYMENFQDIANGMLADDAAIQCPDEIGNVQTAMQHILSDAEFRSQMGGRGKEFVLKNQGALEKVYQLIVQELDKT